MNVIPKLARLDLLAAIQAVSLDGGAVGLFKNDVTPSADTILADLDPCDFGGYASVTILAWGTPFIDPTGLATVVGTLATFAANSGVTPNTAFGVFYVDDGGGLVYAERLAVPFNFGAAGNTLPLAPKFQLGDIPAES